MVFLKYIVIFMQTIKKHNTSSKDNIRIYCIAAPLFWFIHTAENWKSTAKQLWEQNFITSWIKYLLIATFKVIGITIIYWIIIATSVEKRIVGELFMDSFRFVFHWHFYLNIFCCRYFKRPRYFSRLKKNLNFFCRKIKWGTFFEVFRLLKGNFFTFFIFLSHSIGFFFLACRR